MKKIVSIALVLIMTLGLFVGCKSNNETTAPAGADLTGTYEIPAGQTLPIGEVKALVSDQRLLLLRYECDGRAYGNHFITGTPAYDPADMLRWFEAIRRLPEPFDFEL